MTKTAYVSASHQEGGHSTKETSCLLEGQKYIPCTRYMSHSKRVTCSWLTFFHVIVMAWTIRHLSKAGITHLSKAEYITKLSFSDHQFCEHCQYGKQVAASHPTTSPRESSPFDLVHSDFCGPMPHQSLGGASYFVKFIDDSTTKVWAYLARTKDRVFSIFQE